MQTAAGFKSVKRTDRVSFDENLKTFRLYAGESLYAFCISPELTLEHLYWGKSLPDGYDLRYLNQGCRPGHFTTVEAAAIPRSFDGKIIVQAETLEEIQKTWRENRSWSSHSTDDADYSDYVQKKRLENYSWRMMSKFNHKSNEPSPAQSLTPGRRKSHSVAFDSDESPPTSQPFRFRSVSNPCLQNSQLIPSPKLKESGMHYVSPHKSPVRRYKSHQTFERQLGKLGKGVLCVEYTDHGTGDFRSPSLIVVDHFNGSAISPLRYRSHKIYKGKLPLEEMPSIRCLYSSDASTLVVTLVDAVSALEVDLIYGKISYFRLVFYF
jgi:hypothetical protein